MLSIRLVTYKFNVAETTEIVLTSIATTATTTSIALTGMRLPYVLAAQESHWKKITSRFSSFTQACFFT